MTSMTQTQTRPRRPQRIRTRYKIQPADYNAIYSEFGVRWVFFDHIRTVRDLNADGVVVRNSRLAEKLGITNVAIGRVMKKLERLEIVENVSEHPLWPDWVLTRKGEALANYIDSLLTY